MDSINLAKITLSQIHVQRKSQFWITSIIKITQIINTQEANNDTEIK